MLFCVIANLLAKEGVLVAIIQFDRNAKQIVGEPEMISRRVCI